MKVLQYKTSEVVVSRKRMLTLFRTRLPRGPPKSVDRKRKNVLKS